MEIIIIVLIVGLSVYLFMKNKKDTKIIKPKKKSSKKRSRSQVSAKREVNNDK